MQTDHRPRHRERASDDVQVRHPEIIIPLMSANDRRCERTSCRVHAERPCTQWPRTGYDQWPLATGGRPNNDTQSSVIENNEISSLQLGIRRTLFNARYRQSPDHLSAIAGPFSFELIKRLAFRSHKLELAGPPTKLSTNHSVQTKRRSAFENLFFDRKSTFGNVIQKNKSGFATKTAF